MNINSLVCLEIVSLFISFILLYGSVFEIKSRSRKNKLYVSSISLNCMALFFDLASNTIRVTYRNLGEMYVLQFLSFAVGYAVIGIFPVYIMAYVREKVVIKRSRLMNPWVIFFLLTEIMCLVFSITKKYFYYDDAYVYHVGSLFIVSQIFPLFCVLFDFYMIFKYTHVIGRHDTHAMIIYTLLPLITMGFSIPHPELHLAYVGTTLSLLLIYILLQAELERKFIEKEQVLIDESNTDTLTGLFNRRAYTAICDMRMENSVVGVIFCDINGLKYTNDNLGHEAGDQLILDMRDLLLRVFRKDEVYRISGDEFVVMIPHLAQAKFDARVTQLKAEIAKMKVPISAVGASYGNGADLLELIKNAEREMYEDKYQFHVKYPQYARKR